MTPVSLESLQTPGAYALATAIEKASHVLVNSHLVEEGFKSPVAVGSEKEYRLNDRDYPLLGHYRHELRLPQITSGRSPEPMMDWIPQIAEGANFNQKMILQAFGIKRLVDYVDISQRLFGGSNLPTEMELYRVDKPIVFMGFDRSDASSLSDFSRLKEVVWATAMLPDDAFRKAVKQGNFILVINRCQINSVPHRISLYKFTQCLDRIVVEHFTEQSTIRQFQDGKIEQQTPLVVFDFYD